MKKPHHPNVRALLRFAVDGMTVKEISVALGVRPNTILRVLMAMPDAYLDRWVKLRGSRGQYQSVWCVIKPPSNCPYPTARFDRPTPSKVQTQWITT